MKSPVQNRLGEIRKSRGIGASDLASRVGVTRQTIHAIEAGSYVPNTAVALHLARELGVAVDELFSLAASAEATEPSLVTGELLNPDSAHAGQRVVVGRVGSKRVAIPAATEPHFLPEADGAIRRWGERGKAEIELLDAGEPEAKRLILAGCDPATGLLSKAFERLTGFTIVAAPASSQEALRWLKSEKVHIAGSHLQDARSGEYNLPWIRKQFAREDMLVLTLATWEEGLVTAQGNPKSLTKIDDLARKGVRLINRDPGSGSRALLDKLLTKAGVPTDAICGYDKTVRGHLPAAAEVAAGAADVCLATRAAAEAYGLEFIPLHVSRYDFTMRKATADLAAVRAFLDSLQRASIRRLLESRAGYDTSRTGAVLEL